MLISNGSDGLLAVRIGQSSIDQVFFIGLAECNCAVI